MNLVVLACSVGAGIGVIGVVTALRNTGPPGRPIDHGDPSAADGALRTRASEFRRFPGIGAVSAHGRWIRSIGPAVCGGCLVGVATRWPVAALMTGVGIVFLPSMFRLTTPQMSSRRSEAVAIWTELLRDTLTASTGLAQAVVATAPLAPDELRVPALRLADRVMNGVTMDEALRLFADEVNDQSADDVVRALRLAATARAQRLVELLGALADSTRDEVAMRLRVEAGRASARSGVRTVMIFSVGFVAVLVIVARSYLAPFGSLTGQVVLCIVGMFYAAGLALMVHLVRPTGGRRPSLGATST